MIRVDFVKLDSYKDEGTGLWRDRLTVKAKVGRIAAFRLSKTFVFNRLAKQEFITGTPMFGEGSWLGARADDLSADEIAVLAAVRARGMRI